MRTPAYHPLESPLHYFLRLSEANGYFTPTVILHLIASNENWPVLAHWDYAHINKVLPPARHTPQSLTYRWPTSDCRCDLSLLGKPILSRHLNAPHAGVCPECIHELGYAPAWWDLRYAIACSAHRRMLVFRCPKCGKRLLHLRRGLLTCSCGASLADSPEEEPSSEIIWLMNLLKEKVEDPLDGSESSITQRPLRPEDADLDTLCTIIRSLGLAEHRMSGAEGGPGPSSAVPRWLPAVATFLYDWPKGVHEFCARWQGYSATRCSKQSLRTIFPWAFQALFKSRHKRRDRTLFVIDAVLGYVSSEIPGLAVDIRARDLRQLPQEGHTYCGVASAAKRASIPRHTIIKLIRRGDVQYRTARRGSRKVYEIKAETAENLRIDYHPALLNLESPKLLGVTHTLFRDLRLSGTLKKQHRTMMPTAIAICDVEEFKRNILAKASEVANAAGLVSLDVLRVKRCPRGARVGIIKGVLAGTIQCFYTGVKPQRIRDILVRPEDVSSMVAAASALPPPTLARLAARYRLGVYEVRTLARHLSGTPDASARIRPGALNEGQMDEFMARYESLTAYSQERGMSYLGALARLRRARTQLLVLPVPHLPGRHVYFIHRSATQ